MQQQRRFYDQLLNFFVVFLAFWKRGLKCLLFGKQANGFQSLQIGCERGDEFILFLKKLEATV